MARDCITLVLGRLLITHAGDTRQIVRVYEKEHKDFTELTMMVAASLQLILSIILLGIILSSGKFELEIVKFLANYNHYRLYSLCCSVDHIQH